MEMFGQNIQGKDILQTTNCQEELLNMKDLPEGQRSYTTEALFT